MQTKREAGIDDLYRVPGNGKAELVDGELVLMSPTGDLPGYAGFKITARSFSPDAAFHAGSAFGGRFIEADDVFLSEESRPPRA